MGFQETLVKLMKERGMSGADLARATGLSAAAVSDYMRGKKEPRGKQSAVLARALHVSMDTLWETGLGQETDPEERAVLGKLRALDAQGRAKVDAYQDDLLASGLYEHRAQEIRIAALSGGVSRMTPQQKQDYDKILENLTQSGKDD